MDLNELRTGVAEFLCGAGVEAVCAFPTTALDRKRGAVAAVSVRSCEGGPGGFQDYLGERWNQERGCWEELYGKKTRLILGLDLYAGQESGAVGVAAAFDRMAEAFRREEAAGLRVKELTCGETGFDRGIGLFHCPVEGVFEGYLYAVADEGGAFLDFRIRGEGKQ